MKFIYGLIAATLTALSPVLANQPSTLCLKNIASTATAVAREDYPNAILEEFQVVKVDNSGVLLRAFFETGAKPEFITYLVSATIPRCAVQAISVENISAGLFMPFKGPEGVKCCYKSCNPNATREVCSFYPRGTKCGPYNRYCH